MIYHEEIKIKDSKINRKLVHTWLIEIEYEAKEDLMIILMKNNFKINLILNYWINKNEHIFLDNILILYISIQLFSNILFYILYTNSDYNNNRTLNW